MGEGSVFSGKCFDGQGGGRKVENKICESGVAGHVRNVKKKKRCILIQRCMILIHSVSVQVFFQSHFYQSTGDKRNFGATCLAMFILHIQMVELDLREYLLLIRVDLKQLF